MAVTGILRRIVERTLEDVQARRSRVSRRDLEERAARRTGTRRDLAAVLLREGTTDPVRFICEIKRASPSRGVLHADLDAAAQAGIYAAGGAAAVSVVTEPHFFNGRDEDLALARRAAAIQPVLRKDFHVHELQVLEAAAGEADALLLLAGALDGSQLKDYLDIAAAFGLGHLVEAGDRKEAETAVRSGARVIGVNNRDLATFRVDPERTFAVLPVLREAGVVSVAESGIHDRETVLRFQEAGVDALLVGEALVTSPDPAAALRALRGISGDGGAG